jgi:hypothetical protein
MSACDRRSWRALGAAVALVSAAPAARAGTAVVRTDAGWTLEVDGQRTLIRGMNWGYSPVGTNYRYSLWTQDDAFIRAVLDREMPLLRAMGANAIRQYDDIPPRWVTYIYETYGIRTMVNPLFGRYGLEVDGRWVSQVDYADPAHRQAITAATLASVDRFRDTPGVLLWLLGNENNYGLAWTSFEIGDLPQGERDAARAVALYRLVGEVVDAIHARDANHPVAFANGDLQYLSLLRQEAPHLDILGTNVYRGASAGDLYARVAAELGVPVLFTEFGADAWDAKAQREDPVTQARYLVSQWGELYGQVAGREGADNAIGGFVFQWDDGWWKTGQEKNLDVHDTTASWSNGAYPEDFSPGLNNMNEEWFGLCAKGPTDAAGHYALYPRPGYYALAAAWQLDPYAAEVPTAQLTRAVAAIAPGVWLPTYQTALSAGEAAERVRADVRDLRIDLWTLTTQDDRVDPAPRFDHTESVTGDFGLRPAPGVDAHAAVNVLGHVASNYLDDITYETRGRALTDAGPDGTDLSALERVRLYQAGLRWDSRYFELHAYHREGHYHWGNAGDVFGFYREAYYGEAVDTYDADVPSGVEVQGKGPVRGLALAFGPQIYWGANPTVIAKYRVEQDGWAWTFAHQEDLAAQSALSANRALPMPVGRKTSLSLEGGRGPWRITAAGLMAGTEDLGRTYTEAVPAGAGASYAGSGYHLRTSEIQWFDTLGGLTKLSYERGRVHAYARGSWRGLVSAAGPDPLTTFTGWTLRDAGNDNVAQLLTGVAVDVGHLQIAPNALIQRPHVGPLPSIDATWDPSTGWYTPAVRGRNVVDDPFYVDSNRETVGGELLLVWDPTPATWFWSWDAAVVEDAPLALALDLVYRHQPTSRDATLGFTEDGTLFTFDGAPPAQDVWDASLKWASNPGRDVRLQGQAYAGTAQSTGDDARLVLRSGVDATAWWHATALRLVARFDDYGPYDYYRTFNLTFPFQGLADVSTGLTGLRLPAPGTRLGLRAKYRSFDEFSPDATTLGDSGQAYEIATYLHVRR